MLNLFGCHTSCPSNPYTMYPTPHFLLIIPSPPFLSLLCLSYPCPILTTCMLSYSFYHHFVCSYPSDHTTKTPSLHYLPYPRHISPLHILIGLQLQNLFLSLDFHIVLTTITQGIILSILENHRNRFMERASKAVLEWRRRLAAGGEAPPPSPERQATIEAPFEDTFTYFLSCYASMVSSLLWLHSRFWILCYAWTRSENWLTIVLISKVSLFSMLLVAVLALGLVHCFWSVFLLIYGKKSVTWVRRASKVGETLPE